MIDRKRYLELCQINSVYYPMRAKVKCDGIEYYPKNLVIWFNSNSEAQNSATMYKCKSGSQLTALLADLEEVKE